MKFTAILMAFFLLAGSFFPEGDSSQLLSLIELEQHFRLHVREAGTSNEEVSFQRFLQMHYFNTQTHRGDHEQDHKDLPFHHVTPLVDYIVPLFWSMAQLTPPTALQHLPASSCSLLHSESPASIFHPPIIC